MSHPAELISRIRLLLESDYPSDLYRYQIEKAIPGTRMLPDILILSESGQMQCAVEIGYTRPEKLTAYRQTLKIPDVRWYDKQGNLHGDVTEKTVRVSLEMVPAGIFTIWRGFEVVPCLGDNCSEVNAVCDDDDEEDGELENDIAASYDACYDGQQ